MMIGIRSCVRRNPLPFGSIFFDKYGAHRDLHRVDRRQRQMCIRDRLTSDYMLEVIDWAEPDEVEDMKELWDSEIEKLKRVSGL